MARIGILRCRLTGVAARGAAPPPASELSADGDRGHAALSTKGFGLLYLLTAYSPDELTLETPLGMRPALTQHT